MADIKAAADEILKGIDRLAAMSPSGTASFSTMMSSIENGGLTPAAVRAVAAAALGVADGCETCARRNARDAAHRGVTREQFKLALQRGILMGRTSVSIYAAAALADFDEARPRQRPDHSTAQRKVDEPVRTQRTMPAARPTSMPVAIIDSAKRDAYDRTANVGA